MCCKFFERLKKHSTEIVFLWSPNKGSSCEGKILAYTKKQVDLISSMLMLRACFFPSVLSLLQSMVQEGWWKMLKVQRIEKCWWRKSLLEKILSKIKKIWYKLVFLLKRPKRITSNLAWRLWSCVFLISLTVVLNCLCSTSLVCELWVQRCWSFSLVSDLGRFRGSKLDDLTSTFSLTFSVTISFVSVTLILHQTLGRTFEEPLPFH